jgi:hypothetical protein
VSILAPCNATRTRKPIAMSVGMLGFILFLSFVLAVVAAERSQWPNVKTQWRGLSASTGALCSALSS